MPCKRCTISGARTSCAESVSAGLQSAYMFESKQRVLLLCSVYLKDKIKMNGKSLPSQGYRTLSSTQEHIRGGKKKFVTLVLGTKLTLKWFIDVLSCSLFPTKILVRCWVMFKDYI